MQTSNENNNSVNVSPYDVGKTVVKAGQPALGFIILKVIIQWAGSHTGHDIGDDAAIYASAVIYGMIQGVANFLKNWRK